MKRFLSFILCMCIYMTSTMVAFAAEDIPEGSNISIVQEENAEISTRATYSNSVTIPGGSYTNGNFTVKNPHTIILSTNGTVTLQSSNPDARVNVVISGNAVPIFNQTLTAGDSVDFKTSNHASEYVVSYFVYSTKRNNDITLTVTLK